MDLEACVLLVIGELDRLHPNGALDPSLLEKDSVPTFYTASNGHQRYFSTASVESTRNAARFIYGGSADLRRKVKEKNAIAAAFKAFADLHATEAFSPSSTIAPAKKSKQVDDALHKLLLTQPTVFHHYIGASALDADALNGYLLGPVRLYSRQGWLDSVPSPALAEALALALQSDEQVTVDVIRERVVGSPRDAQLLARLASDTHFLRLPLKHWPLILEIEDEAVDHDLSRERAMVVAKAAMDSLALLFADPDAHRSIGLHESPHLPPLIWTLTKVPGQGFARGSRATRTPWTRSSATTRQLLADAEDFLNAAGKAMKAFLDPSTHPAPMLAQRWLIALRWFGEGCRETDDQIGLAKLATSLDTLSCGGKANGITDMLCHMTGNAPNKQVVMAPFPKTLRELVADIYNDGRSRILHGTYADPMRPFSVVRGHATYLARVALEEALMRWEGYSGADTEKAFRSIPA